MNQRTAVTLLLFTTGLIFLAPSLHAQTGSQILDMVDTALFLDSYTSTSRLETIEPGMSNPRVIELESKARKVNGTYMELLAPARSKGTRFLQLEGSLWMYNPKTGAGKALQLSGRDSFQGSAFSNSDVGKSQFSDDYDAGEPTRETIERPDLGKAECWRVEARAKHEKAAYGSIVMWVRITDSMPLRMEYHARSGLLFKRMELLEIKDFGPLRRPSVMRMESLEKAGTISTVTILAMNDVEVPASVFNKNHLTR